MHSDIPPTADFSGPNASALALSRSSSVLSPDQAVLLALRPALADATDAKEVVLNIAGSCIAGGFESLGQSFGGGVLAESREGERAASWGEEAGGRKLRSDPASGSAVLDTGVLAALELSIEAEGESSVRCSDDEDPNTLSA